MLDMSHDALPHRLNNFFNKAKGGEPISQPAFTKLRANFDHTVFEIILRDLVGEEYSCRHELPRWNGYHLLGIDGSRLQLPQEPDIIKVFGVSGGNKSGAFQRASARISVLYDVLHGWALDPAIEHTDRSERAVAFRHIDFLAGELPDIARNAVLLMDRGYPSYEMLRKCEEFGLKFAIRCNSYAFKAANACPLGKLLVFGRLLHPASKCATIRQNDDYYEPVLEGHNPDNVYDTLTFIAQNKDKLIRRINTNLVKKAGRSPEIIYYDVTNFYFEIEDPDDDILDGDGMVLEKGQRKMGVCKEERKQPIVQMGLFMDDDGIPIAVESFPGNTLDHLTLRPALEKYIDGLGYPRFILIADRGICQYRGLLHVLDGGNGYIVSKSLLKSTKAEQRWAYSDDGYIQTGADFKYKSGS